MRKKIAPAPVATGTGAGKGRCDSTPDHSKNHASNLAAILDHISADDRRWFEQHPKCRWRIRPPMPGEVPAGELMAVRSFGPVRTRIPLFGTMPEGLTDRGIDRLMQAIVPPQIARLLTECEAIAKEARR